MRAGLLLGLALIAGLIAGAEQTAAPAADFWLDVPFVKQEKNGCGAACISMVIRYWADHAKNVDAGAADSEKIQRLLYSRKADGIFASDMKRYFREAGFRTFAFRGDWNDLIHHLSQGRPLIVSLKESGEHGPLHYVVVAGFADRQQCVLVNDPALRKLSRLDRAGFWKDWQAAGNWTLLALPQPRR